MKKNQIIPLLLFVIVLFFGCKNEYDIIGLNLQNSDEQLGNNFTDSTTLIAFSVLEDSINTTNLANSVLGYLNDPVFGMTQAGIFSQFMLSGNSVNFGTDPVLDSIVLSLQYSGYFGDTLSPLSIKVFELKEELTKSTKYYNFSQTDYLPENQTYIPNYQLFPRPATTITIDSINYEAHIRIRLKDELGMKFITNQNQLTNDETFLDFFKGLHIMATSTSGTGSLLYINITSSVSGINLYYHNLEGRKKYTFVSSSKAVFYNSFKHDYNLSTDIIFKNQIINGDSSLGNQRLYAQPLAGVKTKIKFPFLQKTFYGKNIIINKAELIISNVMPDELYLFQPYSLGLQAITGSGVSYLPDDAIYTGSAYFGGIYNESTKEYRFRITQYVQQLIRQSEAGQGLYLVVNGAGIRGNRLIFGGTDAGINAEKRLRLELRYTSY